MDKTAKMRPRAQQYVHSVALAKKPNKKAKKRRSRTLPPYMTVEETRRFFRAVTNPRDRGIFKLLYFHAMRVSEIALLQFGDYRPGSALHLDRMMIRRLKGSISSETALVPEAAKAVRSWVKRRGNAPGPLFLSRQRKAISRSRIFRLMREYCEIAQIPPEKSHPHTWKHTSAVHLLADRKEDLVSVQRHCGHKSIRSTMQYLALTSEFDESRIRRLSEWR